MENKGNIIVPLIGYVIAIIYPMIGLIYGALLFFLKKDNPTYYKHGRLIIIFSIVVFVVSLIINKVILAQFF